VDGPAKLSQLQTDFTEAVGKRHGLKRGIKGSKAQHTTVKEFYAAISQPEKRPVISAAVVAPQVLEKGFMRSVVESQEQVAARLTRGMHKVYDPVVKAAKAASLDRKRAEEKEATLQSIQERYGAFFDAIDAIPSPNGRKRALEALEGVRAALEAEWEAEMQADADAERMRQQIAWNMQQATPGLSWEQALAKVEQMADEGDQEGLVAWAVWVPPSELAHPAATPTRTKRLDLERGQERDNDGPSR
jgi:hypothetical protein